MGRSALQVAEGCFSAAPVRPTLIFSMPRPARGGELLLLNYIGFMAGQANPLVGCRARLGGRMRRHGPWREMLRKIRLQDLAFFRGDRGSPSHHLGDGIRPPGQR